MPDMLGEASIPPPPQHNLTSAASPSMWGGGKALTKVGLHLFRLIKYTSARTQARYAPAS